MSILIEQKQAILFATSTIFWKSLLKTIYSLNTTNYNSMTLLMISRAWLWIIRPFFPTFVGDIFYNVEQTRTNPVRTFIFKSIRVVNLSYMRCHINIFHVLHVSRIYRAILITISWWLFDAADEWQRRVSSF